MTRQRILRAAAFAAGFLAVAGVAVASVHFASADRGTSASASRTPDGSGAQATASALPIGPAPTAATPTPIPPNAPAALATPVAADPVTYPWAAGQLVFAPVAVTQPAAYGNGVSARVVAVQKVQGVAGFPGERSGPAVAATVAIDNRSPNVVSLADVLVDLYGAGAAPGTLLVADPHSAPMSGTLAPGASAAGTYVLLLPAGTSSGAFTLTVSYDGALPAVAFHGTV